MSDVRNMVMGRWKSSYDDNPALKRVRATLDIALDAQDAVREKHAALAKNPHLSPLGRTDDIRGFVAKSTAPVIQKARAAAIAMRQDVEIRRSRLQPPKPDPKDVSAAVLRSEMRTQLRGMSASARAALLLSQNSDPTLVQSVLEAPGFSSGVTDEVRQRMLELIVNRDHPTELASIAETEEAVEVLEAAIGMTRLAAKSVSEFPSERMFEDFIDASAPKVTPAPLPLSTPSLTPLKHEPSASSDAFYEGLLAAARADLTAD